MNDQRIMLRAIVAIWMTNGGQPVPPHNELTSDHFEPWGSDQIAEDMHGNNITGFSGLLERHDDQWGHPRYKPTAKGVFEALS